jgi:hypothetical protein
MNLFQHILFLLTVLSLVSGCSQLPPPQFSIGTPITEEKNQVVRDGAETPIVKPAEPAIEAPAVYVGGSLKISQKDAEVLHGRLLVSESDEKRGKHLVCEKSAQGATECRIDFDLETGTLSVQNDPAAPVQTPSELDADYRSSQLLFSKTDQLGVLSISGPAARIVFTGMTHPVGSFDLQADETHLPGVRRKGQHIDCYEQYLKSEPKYPQYTCYLYFQDRTTGEFQVIQ